MGKRCVVAGCSKTHKDNVSLYSFPGDAALAQKWIQEVKRSKPKWSGPTPHHFLCSAHFTEDCFEPRSRLLAEFNISVRKKRQLKEGAIPSVFPKPRPTENNSTETLSQSVTYSASYRTDAREREHVLISPNENDGHDECNPSAHEENQVTLTATAYQHMATRFCPETGGDGLTTRSRPRKRFKGVPTRVVQPGTRRSVEVQTEPVGGCCPNCGSVQQQVGSRQQYASNSSPDCDMDKMISIKEEVASPVFSASDIADGGNLFAAEDLSGVGDIDAIATSIKREVDSSVLASSQLETLSSSETNDLSYGKVEVVAIRSIKEEDDGSVFEAADLDGLKLQWRQ